MFQRTAGAENGLSSVVVGVSIGVLLLLIIILTVVVVVMAVWALKRRAIFRHVAINGKYKMPCAINNTVLFCQIYPIAYK